jgi:4-amino-4-deoxy-L-arabinose transferase-like glycosyltransferase
LAILAAGAFLLLVGHGDIASSHEARVAATARTMAEAGWPWNATPVSVPRVAYRNIAGAVRLAPVVDAEPMHVNPWGVPVLTGNIRLQKPPLPYWCDAVLFRLMGASALAARLIPALLGALATFLLFDLAQHLIGRRAAWYAALIWVSSYFIPEEYRKTMADPYLGFFVLACAWAWVRAATDHPRQRRHLLLFYLFVALGLLAKGPPLFVHLLIVIGAFHACFRRKMPGKWLMHTLGWALVLVIGLPWPLYVLRHVGYEDVLAMWRYESVGELGDNIQNARPWWFYLPQVFLLILPWFTLAGLGIIRLFAAPASAHMREQTPRRWINLSPARRQRLFPLIWFVATLLFFSLVSKKKNAYLLPAMPALAMLMAQGAVLLLAWASRKRTDPAPGILAVIQGLCGAGLAAWLTWLLLATIYRPPLPVGIAMAVVGLIAAACPLWIVLRAGQRPWAERWIVAQAISYALLISLLLNFYDGAKDNRDSARLFLARITPRLLAPGCTLYRQEMSPDAAFYLPRGLGPFDPAAPCVYVIIEGSVRHPRQRDVAAFEQVPTAGQVTAADKVAEDRLSGWSLYALTVRQPATRPATSQAAHPPLSGGSWPSPAPARPRG